MKTFLRIVLVLLLTPVLLVGGAWLLARSSSPAVPLEGPPDDQRHVALEAVLENMGDPRDLEDGKEGVASLDQKHVDALAAEASRRVPEASGEVTLLADGARVQASARSPYPSFSPYLDVTATLSGTPQDPKVSDAWLGNLPVPQFFAQQTLERVLARVEKSYLRTAELVDAVQSVDFYDGRVEVHYVWSDALADAVRDTGRSVVVQFLGRERLMAHLERVRTTLAEAGVRPDREKDIPIGELLRPTFALAQERIEGGEDVQKELRAAVLVVTFYVVQRPFDPLLEEDAGEPLPRAVARLWDRQDLPKHFLISALLTLFGDRSFADALGLEKELKDADGGSGFSFADLAADRSGTQMMELATAGEGASDRAEVLVTRLAAPHGDGDLCPEVGDLPEGMDQATFEAIYRAPGTPKYEALVSSIDAQIAQTGVRRAIAGGGG